MKRLRRVWLLFAGIGCWIVTSAGPALAQSYPGGDETPDVGGEKFFPQEGTLGRTGTDILWLVLIALAVLVVGLAIRSIAKRSARSES